MSLFLVRLTTYNVFEYMGEKYLGTILLEKNNGGLVPQPLLKGNLLYSTIGNSSITNKNKKVNIKIDYNFYLHSVISLDKIKARDINTYNKIIKEFF
ncbi:MAG: hypothetical protein Ta2D_04190 [Rickettsiales bacterium]|nr:MAG: hypothetical protein Ta2D_04190 [Rickettsiales bacterium]